MFARESNKVTKTYVTILDFCDVHGIQLMYAYVKLRSTNHSRLK